MENKNLVQESIQESDKYSLNSFYDDANIFITGATGFLGKLLVRKLLSTFPKINKIYILVRPKKGVSSEQRIQEYYSQKIFDGLLSDCPDFISKVIGVSGDISEPELGLSNADITMLKQEVEIVFHGAASVILTEPLKTGLKTNTRSVLELLAVCKDMHRLKCILSVSTAFSHSHIRVTPLKEEFIPSEIKYQNILQVADLLDSDTLARITPALIGEWVNEYSFTKYLAENICWESDLPVGIFRPGFVSSTYQDPLAGWTDNLYTSIGISALVQSGIIRCLRANPQNYSHVVPADSCINAMIAAAAEVYERRKVSSEILVYNYCSADNPLSWRQFFSKHQLGMEYPLISAIWAPVLLMCSSNLGYKIGTLFLHFLPSYICDLILLMRGKNPKYSKLYRKLQTKYLDVFTVGFTTRWHHEYKNSHKLWDRLTIEDRQRLPFHMPDLSWDDYFKLYIKGIGKYMKNQKDEDLPAARRKYLLFRSMNKLIVALLVGITLWFVWMLL